MIWDAETYEKKGHKCFGEGHWSLCCARHDNLLPLLGNIDNVVFFAPKQDVYISNFVAAQQVCQGHLFKFYLDIEHAFAIEEFWSFKQLASF